MSGPTIFAGSANAELASAVARELGVELASCAVERFPDGETWVGLEAPVCRRRVYVVQPTSPPVNDNLVELLAFADACRRGAAARITAVVPYFGYARQDKRGGRCEPITASLVARVLEAAGVDHVVTFDLHTDQMEGFFHIPVDNLGAVAPLCAALDGELAPGTVVVSPDAGRVKMASAFARRLRCPVAVLHKERLSGTETRVTHVVGDVRDRPCLVIDDMISTGGTIAEAVEALVAAGARAEIAVAATHGLFTEGARDRLRHAAIRRVLVTDTISSAGAAWPGLERVTVAPLVADAIRRLEERASA